MSSKSGGASKKSGMVLMKRGNEESKNDHIKGQAPTLLRDGQPIPGQAWNPKASKPPSQKINQYNGPGLDYRYPENRYYENRNRDRKSDNRKSRDFQNQQYQRQLHGQNGQVHAQKGQFLTQESFLMSSLKSQLVVFNLEPSIANVL